MKKSNNEEYKYCENCRWDSSNFENEYCSTCFRSNNGSKDNWDLLYIDKTQKKKIEDIQFKKDIIKRIKSLKLGLEEQILYFKGKALEYKALMEKENSHGDTKFNGKYEAYTHTVSQLEMLLKWNC